MRNLFPSLEETPQPPSSTVRSLSRRGIEETY